MKNKKQYVLILGFLISSLHLFAGTDSVCGDTISPKAKINLQEYFVQHVRYPELAMETGTTGTVWITAKVTLDGNLDSIFISKGVDEMGMEPDPGKRLNEEALRVVKLIPLASFDPGTINGQPAVLSVVIPIRFEMSFGPESKKKRGKK
jgi:TonB family protein